MVRIQPPRPFFTFIGNATVLIWYLKNGKYELIIPPPDYPGKRYRGRYAYEHHVVWWQSTGELLRPGEVIHHKNDQKRENIHENLERQTRVYHSTLHGKRQIVAMTELICAECGIKFMRPNRRINKSYPRYFCSKSHQIKRQQRERWEKFHSRLV